MFRGKKFAVRLALLLAITLLVVLIQIISLTRLNVPTPYPWETAEREEKKIGRDGGRDLRTVQTTQQEVSTVVKQSLPKKELSTIKETHSTASSEFTLPSPSSICYIKSKDARSALERAKTEECRMKIHNITCLAQAGKLYDTGIKNSCPIGRNPAKHFQHVPYEKGKGPLPRIAYLLSVHGRAVRQLQRLFKTIYHSDHFYIIHVDARSDYLHREVVKMMGDYPNVYIPKWQMASIWGGASLLQVLLRVLEDLEYSLTHWKWDFFINLSESDYPLKTNDELVQFLRVHQHSNFVKTHGGDINKFIQKQGLDRTFVECENHMWRVGDRPLPSDITIDGGSDWIAINRNYSRYLVTNQDPFLKGLKRYYEYSLLPAESFFHTVLRNGPLCNTLVRTNLRITNWNRKLGCRCQYKHVVDWCGCSPNDFLPKDIGRLKNPGDHHFFGRKFEAIVNQQVIYELHTHLYGAYADDVVSLNSYWQNIYHIEDTQTLPSSAHYTVYHSFMRHSQTHLIKTSHGNDTNSNINNCDIPVTPVVKEVNVYYKDDHFVGYLFKYQNSDHKADSIVFEALFIPTSHSEDKESQGIANRVTALEDMICIDSNHHSLEYTWNKEQGCGHTIIVLVMWFKEQRERKNSCTTERKVGSDWDGKESIFRNYGGILGAYDHPAAALRLNVGRLGHITIVWKNPVGDVIEKHDLKLEPSAFVTYHKPRLEIPIMPGVWKVQLESESSIFKEETFMVSPLVFDKKTPLENPLLVNAKRIELGVESSKYIEWRNNVSKTGSELDDWIDKLVGDFWHLRGMCSTGSCKSIPHCEDTSWSSLFPDPKSELGPVQPNGKIR